jgi:hypothetical protein
MTIPQDILKEAERKKAVPLKGNDPQDQAHPVRKT